MSHISTKKLAEMAGLTVRQIQRLAESGLVPGARRTPGRHWNIPETPQIRSWAKRHREMRSSSPPDRFNLIRTLQRGVVAGESLAELVRRGQMNEVAAYPPIGTAISRLEDAVAGGRSRSNRGGGWKKLEEAVDAIVLFKRGTFPTATKNEKIRFQALLDRINE